jgi:hypothetical protein
MVPSTQGNGWALNDTGTACRCGLIIHDTKDTGEMIRRMGKESFIMRMEMYMTEIGEMTKRTEKENILMQTELFTMETGWMIGSMDSE